MIFVRRVLFLLPLTDTIPACFELLLLFFLLLSSSSLLLLLLLFHEHATTQWIPSSPGAAGTADHEQPTHFNWLDLVCCSLLLLLLLLDLGLAASDFFSLYYLPQTPPLLLLLWNTFSWSTQTLTMGNQQWTTVAETRHTHTQREIAVSFPSSLCCSTSVLCTRKSEMDRH